MCHHDWEPLREAAREPLPEDEPVEVTDDGEEPTGEPDPTLVPPADD